MRSGPNLVSNPNFSSTSGWELINGANLSSGFSHQNDGSGSINLPYSQGNPNHPINSQVNSAGNNYIPVTAGQVYTVSGYMYTKSSTNPFIYIILYVYNSNHQLLNERGFSFQGVSSANEWQEVASSYRAQAGDAFVRLRIMRYPGQDNLTTDVWFDDAYFGTGVGFAEAPAEKQAFDGALSRIDKYGNIEVNRNGKWEAFFPICVYNKKGASQSELNAYSNQGFNCTMWGFIDEFSEDYFKSRQNATSSFNPNGLMAMGDITQYTVTSNTSHFNNISLLTSSINNMMALPSFNQVFLGYYFDNEQYNQYPVIKSVTDTIKNIDKSGGKRNHFIFMLQGNPGLTRIFDSLVDTVGDYVDPGNQLVVDRFRILNNVQNQNKPVTFGINSNQIDGSENALRTQLYQLIISGGKGIAVFRDPVHNTNTSISQTDAWKALPELRREIDKLVPLIRQPHWTGWNVSPSNTTLIQVGTRNYNDDAYLILVNPSNSNASVTYTLSGLSYKPISINNYFDNAKLSGMENTQFTVTLPAYGTAVYHFARQEGASGGGGGGNNNSNAPGASSASSSINNKGANAVSAKVSPFSLKNLKNKFNSLSRTGKWTFVSIVMILLIGAIIDIREIIKEMSKMKKTKMTNYFDSFKI